MPKTIFNSTEKSNFILNMTDDKMRDYAFKSVIIAICITLLNVFTEFFYQWGLDLFAIPSFTLAISGTLGMIMFIIAIMKKKFEKNQYIFIALIAISIIFVVISSLNAFLYPNYSPVTGFFGRYEGAMVYISYAFLFIASSLIYNKKAIQKILNFIVIVGLINCVWAALQHIPKFPSYYHNLKTISLKEIHIPSGLSGSPLFFASLLCITLSISAIGTIFSTDKKKQVLYTISTAFFSFFIIKTQTIIGLISFIMILITFLIFNFSCKKSIKTKLLNILIILVPAILAIIFMFMVNSKLYYFDGVLMGEDSYYRLQSTGVLHVKSLDFDIYNFFELYQNIWSNAFETIKKFPLVGTGPDAYIFTQLTKNLTEIVNNVNAFDRPYNDYLYHAAIYGIPFALVYVVIHLFSIKNSFILAKNKAKDEYSWINKALVLSIVSYSLINIINSSTPTVAPLFWILAGLSCGKYLKENKI